MSCTYALTEFLEQLNVLMLDDDGITPMEKFANTKTYITLNNRHTWVSPFYVLDARLPGNTFVILKWGPL